MPGKITFYAGRDIEVPGITELVKAGAELCELTLAPNLPANDRVIARIGKALRDGHAVSEPPATPPTPATPAATPPPPTPASE